MDKKYAAKIPCLDLKQQHQKIKSEIFEIFEKVYDETAFSGGKYVEIFENQFADFIGGTYAIGVSNGTTALHLAMLALGIGHGDEVILPANTFIATAWGVTHAGATPVFVDCDENNWQISPQAVEKAITKKTKAIIGVHLYGQVFDIDAIENICKKYHLFLIEDTAQAHGAKYKNKTVGTFGQMGCFSFYPGKNLGACGEAGGIITNIEAYKKKLHSLRNHGSIQRYFHDEIGYNYRMGGLEAASLSVKLKYLEQWNNRRREIAFRYQTEINNTKIKFQKSIDNSFGVYHLFVVISENKNNLVSHLEANGIAPAYHYPVPCHLQKAYSSLNYKSGDFPHAEYLAANCVSLPMYPELSNDETSRVIDLINKF